MSACRGRAALAAERAKTAKLVEALGAIREAAHYACTIRHGMQIVETPGHEINCEHARQFIRSDIALREAAAKASEPGGGTVCMDCSGRGGVHRAWCSHGAAKASK